MTDYTDIEKYIAAGIMMGLNIRVAVIKMDEDRVENMTDIACGQMGAIVFGKEGVSDYQTYLKQCEALLKRIKEEQIVRVTDAQLNRILHKDKDDS